MDSEAETVDALGRVKKELRPKRENIYAGYVIATILCGGGAYLLYGAKHRVDPSRDYFLGAAVLIGAVGMIWYMRRLSQLFVVIHELGFVVHRGRNQLTFPYHRIQCVNEQHSSEGIPLTRGVASAAAKKVRDKTARSYTVIRDDGEEFFFDENIVPRGSFLAGPLRTAQRKHDFEWNTYST